MHICIAFRLLRRGNMKLHALLGYPVSENFVRYLMKNSSASFLCIQETYIISTISQFRNLKVIQKCVHLKCICVWCLDNWSRILSGKPFNTFSMARLKTLQFRLTLTPLSSDPHSPFIWPSLPFSLPRMHFLSLFHHFFSMICDWGSPTAEESRTMIGVFFLFSWPSI